MKVIFKRCDSIVENDFFKALFSEIYRLNPQENANMSNHQTTAYVPIST